MRAAKTSENGFRMLVRCDIGALTLAGRPDGHEKKTDNTLDPGPCSRHGGVAMTTALTRVPAKPTGLTAACALILFVVISILPL
jgi:hypothetical protein